ncbi:MAG: RhuM family protein [Sulfuricurvum sp.]
MSEIILYTTDDGATKIDLRFENGTVWLSQVELAELFQTSKQNISKHIKAIFTDQELDATSTVNQKLTVQKEGEREVSRQTTLYNLDAILAIGYRVRSVRGVQFRRYASTVLKEYLEKGFVLDTERLKGSGGGSYWKDLLDKIRDIRSSEKVVYRQVLDLYATSQDYDPKSPTTIEFFKIVQNKLHYATNEQTAAELIFSRADSTKDFMGLTTFRGVMPTLAEAKTAKNYLDEDELFRLNRLVSAFFDLAEIKAQEKTPMYMQDWIDELDKFATIYGKGVLKNARTISRKQADEKAAKEFRVYEAKTLSPIEVEYLESIKAIQKNVEKSKQK